MRRRRGLVAAIASLVPVMSCAQIAGLGDPSALEDVREDASADATGDEGMAHDGAADAADSGKASPSDSGPTKDVEPLPADAGAPIAYVLSTRFWTLNPLTMTWSGGTPLPASCPQIVDLALDPFGRLFASAGAGGLYRLDPQTVSCTRVGASNGYPAAMTFAPRGTFDPDVEELVGYMPNGDYVRIDTATGAISVKTPGALSGFTVGDVVNVGNRGYVVMTGGSCGAEDCVWEVSLAVGTRVGASAIGNFPSDSRVLTGLAHWGGQLVAVASTDRVVKGPVTSPSSAQSVNGPPGFTSVGFRGAASSTIAPTQ